MTKYLLLLFSLSFFSVESSFINTQKIFRVTKKTSLGVAMGLIPFFLQTYAYHNLIRHIRFLFGLFYLGSSFIKNKEKKEFFKLNFGYAFFISNFFPIIFYYFAIKIYDDVGLSINEKIKIFLPIILGAYVYSYLTDEEENN